MQSKFKSKTASTVRTLSLEPHLKRRIESLIRIQVEMAKEFSEAELKSYQLTWKCESLFDFLYGHIVGELSQESIGIFASEHKRLPNKVENGEISALIVAHAHEIRDALEHVRTV